MTWKYFGINFSGVRRIPAYGQSGFFGDFMQLNGKFIYSLCVCPIDATVANRDINGDFYDGDNLLGLLSLTLKKQNGDFAAFQVPLLAYSLENRGTNALNRIETYNAYLPELNSVVDFNSSYFNSSYNIDFQGRFFFLILFEE